jgi:hypothetical protein
LKGGIELLSRRPRPVILLEVQDVRTRTWGYPAREIIQFLSTNGYRWFRPLPGGTLEPIAADAQEYDGNFVAVPEEKVGSLTTNDEVAQGKECQTILSGSLETK